MWYGINNRSRAEYLFVLWKREGRTFWFYDSYVTFQSGSDDSVEATAEKLDSALERWRVGETAVVAPVSDITFTPGSPWQKNGPLWEKEDDRESLRAMVREAVNEIAGDGVDEAETDLDEPNDSSEGYGYVEAKAQVYLGTSPSRYREQDFYSMPSVDWDPETLELIRAGFQQYLDGRGRSKEDPFDGLGIHGMNRMMETVHYRSSRQAVVDQDATTFTDRIEFKHVVTGTTISLFNRVLKRSAGDVE